MRGSIMNRVRNNKISIIIVLIIFIGVFASFTSMSSVIKVEAADGYPYAGSPDKNDPWGFITCQCTSYAAWRINQNGISFTWKYGGQTWGHAKTWGDAAKRAGLSVDMNPRVGDIGWKVAKKGGAGDYGHVVYISAVNGNTVTCEQYNWADKKKQYKITYEDKSKFSGFIHFSNPQPVHTHSYPVTSSYVEKAPTFTSDGVLRFKCSCGDTSYSTIIPALGDAELKPGKYLIQSKVDPNKYVSVTPFQSRKQGNIALYTRGVADQEFKVVKNENGTYSFRYNEFSLDAEGGGPAATVSLWDTNGLLNQNWYVVPYGDGYCRVVNQYTLFNMDVDSAKTADGTNIMTWYHYGNDAQRFKFILLSCDEHDWNIDFDSVRKVEEDGEEHIYCDYICKDCGAKKTEKLPDIIISIPEKDWPSLVVPEDTTDKNDSNTGNQSAPNNNSSKSSDNKDKGGSTSTIKFSNEWVDGKWYNEDGTQTYTGTLTWKSNATGWWIEDTDGWYPTDQWQKIDGIWYFFKPDGYMASSEYYNGYWFNSDGAWDSQYLLSWKSNSTGWWVEDISGWWPQSSWFKIDGYWYYFDASGYMVTNQYVDGWWISEDGVCY